MRWTYRLLSTGFGFGVWQNRHFEHEVIWTIAVGTITIHMRFNDKDASK